MNVDYNVLVVSYRQVSVKIWFIISWRMLRLFGVCLCSTSYRNSHLMSIIRRFMRIVIVVKTARSMESINTTLRIVKMVSEWRVATEDASHVICNIVYGRWCLNANALIKITMKFTVRWINMAAYDCILGMCVFASVLSVSLWFYVFQLSPG